MKIWVFGLLILSLMQAQAGEVENGKTVKGKAKTIVFEEDLRIGPDGDEYFDVWNGAWVTVEVNKAGHMFLVDKQENRIIQYDVTGQMVTQLGKTGQGPDEFIDLRNLSFLADQSAIAFESRGGSDTLTYLDKANKIGERKTLERLPRAMQSLRVAPDGRSMAGFYFLPPVGDYNQIRYGIMSREREEKIVVSQGKVLMFNSAFTNDKKWWAKYAAPWFAYATRQQGFISYGADSSIYTANVNEYKVTRYDADLKKDLTFTKEYQPSVRNADDLDMLVELFRDELGSIMPPVILESLTPPVIKEALAQADIPERKNVIYGLIPTEDGGVLVMNKHNWKTRESHGDLFDKNGNLVGHAKLPPVVVNLFSAYFSTAAKLWFVGGKAYGIETNEDDELFLVRYKYTIKDA